MIKLGHQAKADIAEGQAEDCPATLIPELSPCVWRSRMGNRQQGTYLFDGRPVLQDVDFLQHVYDVWACAVVKDDNRRHATKLHQPPTPCLREVVHGQCGGGAKSFI